METVDGTTISDETLGLLGEGERGRFASRPRYVKTAAHGPWTSPVMLVTDRRLIVSEDRTLGQARVDFDVSWPNVFDVSGYPFGGTTVQLLVSTNQASAPLELIVEAEFAAQTESAIRSALRTA